MIVLDTNVLSEVLRPSPDIGVVAWLGSQSAAALFTTTVTQAEILYGIDLLPAGSRKRGLSAAVEGIFDEDFSGRLLSFDSAAAFAYAEIAGSRRASGRPISQLDAMIAGVARSRGAILATRNIKDFIDCGLDLIDPWNL
jgi:predicted nucleic acid-binding protein